MVGGRMIRQTPLLVVLVATTVSGCLTTEGAAGPHVNPTIAEASALASILVDGRQQLGTGVGADVLCVMGGAAELRREEAARVLSGHQELVFEVDAGRANTGLQLGHSRDEGQITWLKPVFQRRETIRVLLPPGSGEEGGERWSFYFQNNVEAAPLPCYTGGMLEMGIRIEAR